MDMLLELINHEAIAGALVVIGAWVIGKFVLPKFLTSPEAKARMKLLLQNFNDEFEWVEQNATDLGLNKYEKLAELMARLANQLALEVDGQGTLTPDEQAKIAQLAAEKAKNS